MLGDKVIVIDLKLWMWAAPFLEPSNDTTQFLVFWIEKIEFPLLMSDKYSMLYYLPTIISPPLSETEKFPAKAKSLHKILDFFYEIDSQS